MHSIPKLLDIAQSAPHIHADDPISVVVALFTQRPDLIALPVAKMSRTIGMIRKARLFQILSRAYALDVYSRRPIESLLDTPVITMNPGMDIHSALSALIRIDPGLETDAIPLMDQDICIGIVPVSILLHSISEAQSKLLNILETLTLRIRHEVQKAAEIQQALLPSSTHLIQGIEITTELRTCTEIGGDFFDYFIIDKDRFCVVIGDVSGHGVYAGMVTTAAKASLHTLAGCGVATPSKLLTGMNAAILQTAKQSLLMSCFIAVIHCREQWMQYANAGHHYPCLIRQSSNQIDLLINPTAFPLGFDENAVYQEQNVSFCTGDTALFYSDGIIEGSNGIEDFGFSRLEACLRTMKGQPLRRWIPQILNSLFEFQGHAKIEDDVTLVAVRKTEPSLSENNILQDLTA